MHDLGNPWTRSWAMTMMLWISYCCSRTYQPNSVKTWRMVIFYIVLHWICCTHWILSGSILSGKNGAIEAQHSPAHIQLLPTSSNFFQLHHTSQPQPLQIGPSMLWMPRLTQIDYCGWGWWWHSWSRQLTEGLGDGKGAQIYGLDVQLMLGSKRIEHVSELSLLQVNKHRKTCFFQNMYQEIPPLDRGVQSRVGCLFWPGVQWNVFPEPTGSINSANAQMRQFCGEGTLIAYPPEVAGWKRKRKINAKQCGKNMQQQ